MTSVWLFKPRSHGRKREATRARNGAPLPGRTPSFHVPHRPASSALCPCGHAASFRRRASSFVRGVRWLEFGGAASGGIWLAGPCANPPSGGHGRPCVQGRSRRPQAGAAWAVAARCVRGTSSRIASAACGVRGVRAAQQRGSSRQSYQSKRNASSIMLS